MELSSLCGAAWPSDMKPGVGLVGPGAVRLPQDCSAADTRKSGHAGFCLLALAQDNMIARRQFRRRSSP